MLTAHKTKLTPLLDIISAPFLWINPHYITLVGLFFSFLFFLSVLGKFYVLALILVFGQIFDAMDGYIARKMGKVSKFGGVLDSTVDRASDFFIITAFGFSNLVSWNIVLPLLLSSFLVSYIRSRADLEGKGLIERSERLVIIFTSFFLFLLFPNFSFFGYSLLDTVFLTLAILSFFTFLQRITLAYKKLH